MTPPTWAQDPGEDREDGEELIPSAPPGSGVGTGTEGATCSIGAPEAKLLRDASGLVLPFVEAPAGVIAAGWSVTGKVIYGEAQVKWSTPLTGSPPWEIVLPQGAYFDGWQREWLSRIRLVLYATDAAGNQLQELPVEPAWVVWPDGQTPVWLDDAARRVEAPNGAWSFAAQATVPAEDVGNPNAGVAPPTGGAP
jgi:hypothetical protein